MRDGSFLPSSCGDEDSDGDGNDCGDENYLVL